MKTCKKCNVEIKERNWSRLCIPCDKERRKELYAIKPRYCKICNFDITRRSNKATFCYACAAVRAKKSSANTPKYVPSNDNDKCRKITKYAVKIGFLPSPTVFECARCGERKAECYDHRDYSKPLHVYPVCRKCNSGLGKGIEVHVPCVDSIESEQDISELLPSN